MFTTRKNTALWVRAQQQVRVKEEMCFILRTFHGLIQKLHGLQWFNFMMSDASSPTLSSYCDWSYSNSLLLCRGSFCVRWMTVSKVPHKIVVFSSIISVFHLLFVTIWCYVFHAFFFNLGSKSSGKLLDYTDFFLVIKNVSCQLNIGNI